jgi:LysM repeat protein
VVVVAAAAVLPLSAAPKVSAPDPTPVVSGNLLTNPSFEAPYNKQCCHTEPEFPSTALVDEVQVPAGWRGWWRQPEFPNYPPRCDDERAPKTNCIAFHRPEWRDAAGGGAFDVYRNRIHSGLNAQKYFTFYSIHEAGMYQQVTKGITPGQKLNFSVYLQGWSTNAGESLISSGQQTMNLKVGIDPFGGTDPFSANIVWSKPGDSWDVYSQFSVEAVAQSNKVTVFTYSRPIYPLQHVDVYVDDAALVVVGKGAVTTGASTTSSTSNQTASAGTSPFPGTTVDKDGNILYVVQPGDTAWNISRRFNTTVGQLVAWNNLADATIVRLGKTLIVGKIKK